MKIYSHRDFASQLVIFVLQTLSNDFSVFSKKNIEIYNTGLQIFLIDTN